MTTPKIVDGEWIRDRRCDLLEEVPIERHGGFILSQDEAAIAEATPPDVAAVRAWEVRHGRVMTKFEASAFGQAWEDFRKTWRKDHPGKFTGTSAPITTWAAMGFGESVDLATRAAELEAEVAGRAEGT